MYTGSVMCAAGFLALSHLSNVLLAIVGFGVIGGIGSGLVYATCINMVGKWFPERRGARTGFVNGGFAYGSLPFIFIFNYAFDTANYHRVLDLIGCYVMIVVLSAAFFFKDPPKNWWPADIDPLTYGGSAKGAASLSKNPPAVKQFTPKEAIRTGMLPLMWIALVMTAGVSIFGISFQVDYAKEIGFGPLVAASSMGVMAVINGVGRGVVGWLSDTYGRKQTLVFVILVLGLAQFGVIWAGDIHSEALFLIFAFLSGFGGGAFYPMFAALTPDYFGENYNATNYGLVYSGKLISGLFGGGLGSMVVAAWGYDGAYALAAWYLHGRGRDRPAAAAAGPQHGRQPGAPATTGGLSKRLPRRGGPLRDPAGGSPSGACRSRSRPESSSGARSAGRGLGPPDEGSRAGPTKGVGAGRRAPGGPARGATSRGRGTSAACVPCGPA